MIKVQNNLLLQALRVMYVVTKEQEEIQNVTTIQCSRKWARKDKVHIIV